MEFEELQAIWDTQNNQQLYAFNEKALHNRIVAKKYHVIHITTFSEWLLMITNIAAGAFIVWRNAIGRDIIFLYVLAAWLFGSALYVVFKRIQRLKEQQRFDHSMLGDLQHAFATASYQVRLSGIMRWNIFPIGLLVLAGLWETGKWVWPTVCVVVFVVLVFYASAWEHRIYKSKKAELEALLRKLQNG